MMPAARLPAAAALMLMMALQLSAAAAMSPGVPIGLPNCSTTCGDVVVPYPFGLGPSRCYWPGLNLTCDTSRHPPRLLIGDDGNLRVTEISLRNQTMRVMGSRAVVNTTGGHLSSDSWNLLLGRGFTRYGYRLSYRNELVVDGCNAAATLLADSGFVVAGCASLCTGSRGDIDDFFFSTTACTGTSGCCRAPLTTSAPGRLEAKSLVSGSGRNRTVEPLLVYVAEAGWIDHGHHAMMGTDGVDEAPILLAWSVTRGLPPQPQRCDDDTRRRLGKSQNSRCLADLGGAGFMCQCQDGYDGNPYLPGGCQSIEPYVTIFHWNTPQALEDKYGSFLDQRIVKDYTDFAKVCFEHFGDKVKHWFTFNEPQNFCSYAYGSGQHAPGRCSPEHNCAIPCGDSLRKPYHVGHNILLAHAEVAHLYNNYYKGEDGHIGLAIDSMFYKPYAKTFLDEQAKERSIDFCLGWFMEPLFRGEYPFAMRSLLGHRLPYFKDDEQEKLVGSYNMMGLNYYTSLFCEHVDISPGHSPKDNTQDAYATPKFVDHEGNHIGPETGYQWMRSYPKGLKDLLMIIKDKYGNQPIYITENGTADFDDGNLSIKEALDDGLRLDYLQRHISAVKESIDLSAKVRGHFTWSLLDNFEWAKGCTCRFGLIYVDRNDGFKRYMKKSAKWFSEFNSAPRKVINDDKHGDDIVVLNLALASHN